MAKAEANKPTRIPDSLDVFELTDHFDRLTKTALALHEMALRQQEDAAVGTALGDTAHRQALIAAAHKAEQLAFTALGSAIAYHAAASEVARMFGMDWPTFDALWAAAEQEARSKQKTA